MELKNVFGLCDSKIKVWIFRAFGALFFQFYNLTVVMAIIALFTIACAAYRTIKRHSVNIAIITIHPYFYGFFRSPFLSYVILFENADISLLSLIIKHFRFCHNPKDVDYSDPLQNFPSILTSSHLLPLYMILGFT